MPARPNENTASETTKYDRFGVRVTSNTLVSISSSTRVDSATSRTPRESLRMGKPLSLWFGR